MRIRNEKTRPGTLRASEITSALAALLLAAGPQAQAQMQMQMQAQAQGQAGAQGGPAETASPPAAELPAVTVTARKREEPVQAVPISVTVIDPQATAVAAPADGNAGLARSTPNLSFADSGGQFGNLFVIRGVGSFAPLSSDDTSVVMYLNEVPRSVYGAPPALLDVERVEVMRGPQGTLFGRNTQGGAINVISNAPVFERTFSATAEAGTHGHALGEVVANAPLSDTLAGRLAVRYSNLDGTVPNILSGDREGRVRVGAARGALLWLPGDETAITLSAFHDRRQSDAPRFVWRQNPAFPQSAVDPANDIRWRDDGASLKAEHDFGRVRFTSLTSYQDARSFQPFDLTEGFLYAAMTGRPQAAFDVPYADYAGARFREKTAQQEFRLSSRVDGTFTWTAGINLFRSRFSNDTLAVASPAAFNFQTQNGTQDNRIDTDSAAAFGEGTLALTDRLKATLGLRYTHERKAADYRFTGNGNPATVPFSQHRLRLSDHFATGRAGLSYQWTPDLMAYATVSRGAVSAGYPVVQTNGPLGRPEVPYPTSTSRTYEAGFKSMWLDRRLSLNGSVFYNDVEHGHLIVFDPTQLFFGTASLDYESRGVELEAAASLSRHLKLTAGIGYTHAELVGVPAGSATGARSGNRVPNMPNVNGALGLRYEAPMTIGGAPGRLTAALAWQYVGKRAADVKESFELPGYDVVNARIGWQHGRWELYGFAWNLFDQRYLVAGQAWTPAVSSVRTGQPRVVGIGATVRF
ncbi:MAG: TonB-dependent receptor [Lautropia sp.]